MDEQLNIKRKSIFSFTSTILFALTILLVIGLVASFYFIYSLAKEKTIFFHQVNSLKSELSLTGTQNKDLQNQITALQTKLSQVNLEKPKDISKTENVWVLYSKPSYGFSIKYPSDWRLRDVSYNDSKAIELTKNLGPDREWGGHTSIQIKVNNNSDNLSLEKIVKNTGYIYVQERYTKINNTNTFTSEIAAWGMVPARQFLLLDNSRIFNIIIEGLDFDNEEVDKIINTIEFIK